MHIDRRTLQCIQNEMSYLRGQRAKLQGREPESKCPHYLRGYANPNNDYEPEKLDG